MTLRYASRFAAVAALTLAACSDQPVAPTASPELSTARLASSSTPSRYIVVFRGSNGLARNFEAEVASLGGKVETAMPRIGAAIVSGISSESAAKLARFSGVQSVDMDERVPMRYTKVNVAEANASILDVIASPSAPATAGLFAYQWNMRAINAPAAWTAGYRGSSSVRVGVIDTGIDEGNLAQGTSTTNIDLLFRIDRTLSKSFIDAEDSVVQRLFPGKPLWTDLDGHGTNVASQISSNAINLAGVTSQTRLVSLKACTILAFPGTEDDSTATPGYCSTAAVFAALYYAAEQGIDVVNMSLGGGFPKNECQGCTSLVNRVVLFAKSQGTTVVVAAGNSAIDMDHSKNWYNTYCDAPTVICVSATGPTAATLLGPFVNPDAPAIYSNFGRSAIDVAAPGGNYAIGPISSAPNAPIGVVRPSYILSLCPMTTAAYYDTEDNVAKVFGPCGFVGYIGTSQASPHVAGLAALLVQQLGRNPGAIRERIMDTADQITGGTSASYGKGRINVARAVGAI